MYTFKKIKIGNRTILTLVVNQPERILINFCTILRAKHMWKNQLTSEFHPYTPNELNRLKKKYQDSLVLMIEEYGYAFVDIANGDILNPSNISKKQVLAEYKAPLPF